MWNLFKSAGSRTGATDARILRVELAKISNSKGSGSMSGIIALPSLDPCRMLAPRSRRAVDFEDRGTEELSFSYWYLMMSCLIARSV